MKPSNPGDETFDEAMCALMAEPCPDTRWSMIVHRGSSPALVAVCTRSNAAPRPWNKLNPHFGWAIALAQDPEYVRAQRELFDESERRAAAMETGRDKCRRRDAHARKHWQLFHATVAKRTAEGWTPPAPTAQGPIMQAMVRQLDGMLTP